MRSPADMIRSLREDEDRLLQQYGLLEKKMMPLRKLADNSRDPGEKSSYAGQLVGLQTQKGKIEDQLSLIHAELRGLGQESRPHDTYCPAEPPIPSYYYPPHSPRQSVFSSPMPTYGSVSPSAERVQLQQLEAQIAAIKTQQRIDELGIQQKQVSSTIKQLESDPSDAARTTRRELRERLEAIIKELIGLRFHQSSSQAGLQPVVSPASATTAYSHVPPSGLPFFPPPASHAASLLGAASTAPMISESSHRLKSPSELLRQQDKLMADMRRPGADVTGIKQQLDDIKNDVVDAIEACKTAAQMQQLASTYKSVIEKTPPSRTTAATTPARIAELIETRQQQEKAVLTRRFV